MKLNNMTVHEKNRILTETLISRTVYCGLGDPNEVTSASYKRVPITFSAPSNGQVINSKDIEFPIANEDWGSISKIAIYDSLSGGNKIWESNPEVVKTIEVASQYKIPQGYMIVRLR